MSKITDALLSMGTGIVGQGVNAGMGILLGRSQEQHNDERQLEMQAKLQQMQEEGQKRMTDYNMNKQLEMWKNTSYGAQKEQMIKAGLNPALMYGMGGGGGQTANITQGNVSAGEAPKGGHESYDQQAMGIGMQQQAMQLQLLNAQKENIEADTKNKLTQAGYTEGPQTEETNTRIQELQQGIDNKRQQFEIGKLEITLKNIENFEKQASQQDRLDYIDYQTKMAMKQLDNVTAEAFINKATIDSKIKIIQQTAIGAVLQNALTSAQTGKVQSDIQVNQKQINKWTQEIMMQWDQMDQRNRQIMIDKMQTDFNTDPVNRATDQMMNTINSILHIRTGDNNFQQDHIHYHNY